MTKTKVIITAEQVAKNLIKDPDSYNLMYTHSNQSVKDLKSKLQSMRDDTALMLKSIKTDLPKETKEDADKYLSALNNLINQKSVNETRVRFWINLMMPIMTVIAKNISEEND